MAIKRITTNLIEDGSISTIDIANNAITAAKITDGNITTAKLADLNVTAGKLAGTLDLTGKTVTVATATTGDSDTSPASTAFVQQEIAALVDSSPSALNTLNELANALGDNENFATDVTASIATKAPLDSPVFSSTYTSGQDETLAEFRRDGGAVAAKIIYADATTDMEFGTTTSHALSLTTADTRRLTIDSSGNVGIGATPQSTVGIVDIAGAATNYNTAPMITFRDTAGSTNSRNWSIGNIAINYGDFHIGCGDTNSDYFDATSHSKFMINKDGNVAIGGTPYANAKLTLSGSDSQGYSSVLMFDNNHTSGAEFFMLATDTAWSAGAGKFIMGHGAPASSNADVTIDGDGRVGIGTNSPAQKLHVSGNVTIDTDTNSKFTISDGGTDAIQLLGGTGDELYIGANSAYKLRFKTDGNIVMDNGGSFGIGTSSPTVDLDVSGPSSSMVLPGTSGTTPKGFLRLGYNDRNWGGGEILMGVINDGNTGYAGYLQVKAPTDYSVNRNFIINPLGGHLLVGKTATTFSATGTENRADGRITSTRSGNTNLLLNRLSSDGSLIDFYKDGAVVGSIDCVGTVAKFKSTSNLHLEQNGNSVSRSLNLTGTSFKPFDSNDNQLDLGTSTARFKDLYLSGGVHLGGTGTANELDDYEEGTWTPAISGATHTVQQGYYTKVGDLVFFKLRIAWSAYNNSAGGVLTGLPFTADTAIESMGVNVYVNSGFGSIPSGKGYLNAYIASNNTTLNFTWQPNTAVAEFAGSGNIYVAGTYLT